MNILYALIAFVGTSATFVVAAPVLSLSPPPPRSHRRYFNNIVPANAELKPVDTKVLLASPKRKRVSFLPFARLRRRFSFGASLSVLAVPSNGRERPNVSPEQSGDDDPDSGDVDESGGDQETDESGSEGPRYLLRDGKHGAKGRGKSRAKRENKAEKADFGSADEEDAQDDDEEDGAKGKGGISEPRNRPKPKKNSSTKRKCESEDNDSDSGDQSGSSDDSGIENNSENAFSTDNDDDGDDGDDESD